MKLLKKHFLLSLILFLLCLSACGEKVADTATIFSNTVSFVLENAMGEILDFSHSENSTMQIHEENLSGTGSPAEMMWTVDASKEFVYTYNGESPTSLLILCDAYSYSVNGTGITKVIMGTEGLFVYGTGEDNYRLAVHSSNETSLGLIDFININCTGKEISVITGDGVTTIEGADEKIAVEFGKYAELPNTFDISSAGSKTELNFQEIASGKFTVTDGAGVTTVYEIH